MACYLTLTQVLWERLSGGAGSNSQAAALGMGLNKALAGKKIDQILLRTVTKLNPSKEMILDVSIVCKLSEKSLEVGHKCWNWTESKHIVQLSK